MDFLQARESYFRGERFTGYVMVPVGAVALGAAIYLWKGQGTGLGRGMAVPLAIAGLAMLVGSLLFVRGVNARGDRLTELHATDAAAPVAEEAARMEKVNGNWAALKITWTVVMCACLGVIFGVKREWVVGVALAMLMLAAAAMVLDTFAERRAEVYADRLAASD
jgi:hypothetical protein